MGSAASGKRAPAFLLLPKEQLIEFVISDSIPFGFTRTYID
jgi:hypothetical protein